MRKMNMANKYIIDYKSMPNGHHSLEMTLDGELFAAMESNEVKDAECDVRIELERSETQLLLDIAISGRAVVECDRCLEDCDIPVDYHGELVVRFADVAGEYDGEQMWIAQGDELSLAQYLYESVVVSLPYRRVHEEGGCDPDMMTRFTSAEEQEAEQEEQE